MIAERRRQPPTNHRRRFCEIGVQRRICNLIEGPPLARLPNWGSGTCCSAYMKFQQWLRYLKKKQYKVQNALLYQKTQNHTARQAVGACIELAFHSSPECPQAKNRLLQPSRVPQQQCATPQDKPLVHASNGVSGVAPSTPMQPNR